MSLKRQAKRLGLERQCLIKSERQPEQWSNEITVHVNIVNQSKLL
jgi:hypothetical protein